MDIRELGREGQSGVLWLSRVLQTEGFYADEIFIAIWADRWVRNERKLGFFGDIGARAEDLKAELREYISNSSF